MGRTIVKGQAEGTILRSEEPINFLGSVDKRTGEVRDASHPLYRRPMRGHILVFPYGVGSSVGAYTIYSLKSHDAAPAAMVCKRADTTVASGCALADIPLIAVGGNKFDALYDGSWARVQAEPGVGGTVVVL